MQLHLHPALALICSFLTLFVCETFPVSRLLSSLALHASLLRHSISSTTVAYALPVSIFLQDFCERLHTEVDISAPRFLSLAPIGLLVGSALVSRLHAATTSLLSCALFPLALPTSQLPPPVCLPLKPSEPGPSTCSPAAARRITTLARRFAVQNLRTSLQSSCVIERTNAAHLAATRRAHLLGPTRAADYGLISSALQHCRVATPPQTRFRLSRLGSGNPLRTPRTPSAPENVSSKPARLAVALLFSLLSLVLSSLLCLYSAYSAFPLDLQNSHRSLPFALLKTLESILLYRNDSPPGIAYAPSPLQWSSAAVLHRIAPLPGYADWRAYPLPPTYPPSPLAIATLLTLVPELALGRRGRLCAV